MLIDNRKLKVVREVYRLSCEDFGALIGVSGQFISYVESGKRKLPEKRGDTLVRELALTPEKLARLIEIYDEGTAISSKNN